VTEGASSLTRSYADPDSDPLVVVVVVGAVGVEDDILRWEVVVDACSPWSVYNGASWRSAGKEKTPPTRSPRTTCPRLRGLDREGSRGAGLQRRRTCCNPGTVRRVDCGMHQWRRTASGNDVVVVANTSLIRQMA